jgi:hypothetical protein
MMQINIPTVVEEVRNAFIDYEAVLMKNDTDALDAWFWDSPHTVRYGVAEILHGAEAISAYRKTCQPVPASRVLANTIVTTFGHDYATVSTEFTDHTSTQIGRQMQTWARLDGQWRVVAAHVSLMR